MGEVSKKTKAKLVEKTKRGLSLVYRFFIYIPTAILLLSLFFACLSQYILPSSFMLCSYFGLAFPLILVLCLVWIVILIFMNAWRGLLLMSLSLLCIPMIQRTIPFNVSSSDFIMSNDSIENNVDSTFKVLTYNVRLFSKEKGKSPMDIVEYIDYIDADICFIQEYALNIEKKYPKVFNKLFTKYPYTSKNDKNHTTLGVVIFSKYPILNTELVTRSTDYNKVLYSDIAIKGDTIRAINCHLISNRITGDDKQSLKELGKKDEKFVENLEQVVTSFDAKLITSYAAREDMANDVAKVVNSSDYKLIVAGDFNDVPISYTYNTIKGNKLLCAKEENGVGYNHTFNEFPFYFCIDHIMYSKSLTCISYFRDKVSYSDHYPSMARFKIHKKRRNE